jgi:hypothetical protein
LKRFVGACWWKGPAFEGPIDAVRWYRAQGWVARIIGIPRRARS